MAASIRLTWACAPCASATANPRSSVASAAAVSPIGVHDHAIRRLVDAEPLPDWVEAASGVADINRAINALLTSPGDHKEAADGLMALRKIWTDGADRTEGCSIMLSAVDLYSPEEFPHTRAMMGRDAPRGE